MTTEVANQHREQNVLKQWQDDQYRERPDGQHHHNEHPSAEVHPSTPLLGFRLRLKPNWWWPVVSGVLALAVGVLLWIGWPSTAAWAVGLLFGINLLSSGLSMVVIALNGRNAARKMSAIST